MEALGVQELPETSVDLERLALLTELYTHLHQAAYGALLVGIRF